MGFLKNLFGRKNNNGLPPELNNLMEQMNKQMFPDGQEKANMEIRELANELGVESNSIHGTFLYACTRLNLGGDRETLLCGIKNHNPELSDEQVNTFAKYIFKRSVKQKMGIDDDAVLNEFLKSVGFVDVVGTYDEIPNGFGEFGLEVTNPVPVNGIPANDRYLGRLKTLSGGPITWERLGGCQAENLADPVDLYTIKDEDGNELPPIYISPYHPKTSNKAPKGYCID